MFPEQLQQKIDRGDVPPNLQAGTAVARCGLCKNWDAGAAECLKFGFPTRPTEVCDAFDVSPELVAGAQADTAAWS